MLPNTAHFMTPHTEAPPLDFRWLGRVGYREGLALQQDMARQVLEGSAPDTVLLLEHEPVYTIGRTPDKSSLAPQGAENARVLPHPVVEISRGGQATYHGPGQLVGYPVLALTHYGRDLHRYLRALEEGLILLCASLGLDTGRREGMTGVWCGPRKLASIGVGVRQWISQHGFAINITEESLAGFQSITPCGLGGVEMTCLVRETGRPLSVEESAQLVRGPLADALESLRLGKS